MSVDADTVRRIARLARIHLDEGDVDGLAVELNTILGFVEQLNEVDVTGVAPMTSVTPMVLRQRPDEVTAGGHAQAISANAPISEDNFFMVPKVVE
ncbi:MAG: Asp-tRNA(Asn)/Glu-tRNA(Gln) amidotransferase subunit GatC [Alphaproteobacteria bacterium]|nr:Asp-tRNA(Asn)/Glu-tRNA(Gln) amidotransferase subunit GatC [Alphaproteobacteria bacterium]